MENTIGESADKKAFVGQHDSPVRVGSNGGANISEPSLDTKSSYIVGNPSYKNGGTDLIGTKTADTKNSDTTLNTDYEHVDKATQKSPQNLSKMPSENGEPNI